MPVPALLLPVLFGAVFHSASLDTAETESHRRVRALAMEWESFTDSLSRAHPPRTTWGVEPGEVRTHRAARLRSVVTALGAVEAGSLGPEGRLLHRGLRDGLARQLALDVCRDPLWNVSPLGGPHLALATVLREAPADTSALRAVHRRLLSFADALARHTNALREGLSQGYTASRDNVERVIEQLDVVRAQVQPTATDTPLIASLVLLDGEVSEQLRATVGGGVVQAIDAYRSFLTSTYLPAARSSGSLGQLPGGAGCYRARLAFITGLDTPPDSLLATATARRRAIDAELAPILARLVGPVSLAQAKRAIRTEARFLHTTRDEMLADARRIESRLTPAVGRLFRHPPSAPLHIEPTPAAMERADPPARYAPASSTGSPAIFYLNTWRPDSQPRWNLPIAVAHEGAPGHHLERTYPRSIALPPAARSYGIGAYLEGWGMYAEELAVRESGVLDDDLARAGLLMHYLDAWNALELDLRMHLDGWDRERVIAQIIGVTGKSRTVAALYADRHAATPGQLASYMMGYMAIRDMRDWAERRLGDRFDVRDFHERLLEAGPLPLSLVRERLGVALDAALSGAE